MSTDRRQSTAALMVGVAAAVVLVAGVAALFRDADGLPTAGARVHLSGVATVVHTDGTSESLSDGDVVRAGERVEVVDGTAILELAAGGTVEARAGHGDVVDTLLEVGAPVELLAGDLLATGPAGMSVEAAGTTVTVGDNGDAAARIRRELAVTAATYRGEVAIDSAGERRNVRAFRQISVAAVGRPPTEAVPLRYDVTDPWDLRHLGGAIDLSRQLEALSRAFTAQGVATIGAPGFESLLPRLADEPAFDASLIAANREAGETLVGAAITSLSGRGGFEERWNSVFDFRDDGATWGLVAFDHGLVDASVLDELEAAIGRSVDEPTGDLAAGSPPSGSGLAPDGSPGSTVPGAGTPIATTPGGSTGGSSTGSSPGSGSTPTLPTTPPPTTPALPPPTTPTLPPPPPLLPELPPPEVPETGVDLLDGLVDPVEDVQGGLLGGG